VVVVVGAAMAMAGAASGGVVAPLCARARARGRRLAVERMPVLVRCVAHCNLASFGVVSVRACLSLSPSLSFF
jgi:hypothetical protein